MPSLDDAPRLQLARRHLQMLCALLQALVPQAQVWAYGSRVSGGAHEGSDLDLVLRNPAQLSAPCEAWFDLKEALQESPLPILVDVHDWARLPADFHRNIERAYVELQAGSKMPPVPTLGDLEREAALGTSAAFENLLSSVPDAPDAAVDIQFLGKRQDLTS